MSPFAYERPADLGAALALLEAEPAAKPLAGGTNLVDLMKLGVERPPVLVDVNRLTSRAVSAEPDGGVVIGAGARNSDVAADPLIRTRFPVLAEALLAGASGQLRNMASTAGNLLQRTRCSYFTDASKPCNKREPGSGCPAIEGASRELGVLGVSEHCIATFPGDMAVAMAALDAEVRFRTADGAGSLPLDAFYRLPGDQPQRDTELPPGALITEVRLPGLSFGPVSTYRKARDRRSYAYGLVTVAAAIDVADGEVVDVRLALGAVAHEPWRARTAEDRLRGGPATVPAFTAALRAELAAATPTAQNAYKVPLAERLAVGVLADLAGVAA